MFPAAKGVNLSQVPLPLMKKLSEGDLKSAQEFSTLKLPPYVVSDECRSTWKRRFAQIALDSNDAPWITRFVVSKATRVIVGRAGFHGPPDKIGMVELGYAIDPLHRRRGHARAALEILLGVARNHPDIKIVRATVRPDNLPSRALIDQYGFREVGEQWEEQDGLEKILELSMSPTFEICPAEREDIPRLAQIHAAANFPSPGDSLFFLSPRELEQSTTKMLESQFGDPTWHHIIAVDKASGQIGGWAAWLTLTDEQIRGRDAKFAENKNTITAKPETLWGFVQQQTGNSIARWSKGQRHLRCKALFTDPSFQKRGIGKAMVQYGNDLADRGPMPIFLQATPFGFPLYAKMDFEVLQELDIDLREWAMDEKDADGEEYGHYKFRFMLRLPRTVPTAASD